MIYLVTNSVNLYEDNEFIHINLDEAIKKLEPEIELGLDTETEGLDGYTKELLLLQIGTFDFQVLFDIASFGGRIPSKLVEFLNTGDRLYILQNAKFDIKFLFHQDVILRKVYDTMLAETIITNGLQYDGRDLATLGWKYCKVQLDKSVRGKIIKHGLDSEVLKYGANDVKYLPKIKEEQEKIILKLDLEQAVKLDNVFVIALAYVEYCGIKLDYPKWKAKTDANVSRSLELKKQLEKKVWDDGKYWCFSGMRDMFTGEPECTLNWDSPKQVMKLFKEYGINVEIRVKGEIKESIDSKVLDPQVNDFPILKPYLDYKAAQKEISTYGYNWKSYINKKTGRVHSSFKQLMDTGRLSSGSKRENLPNLQNIPSDELTRSCFIAEKGNSLIDADYSSQEQVVLANFSREPNLINFYNKGFKDMHSYVAFLMYPHIRRCEIDELTPESLKYIPEEYGSLRKLAKNAGFAINYGGNGSTIAKNCNISKADGEFVYKSYFESFPLMRRYFDHVFNQASENKYVQFNYATKRKYFFDEEENDYFKYKEDVEDPYFWQTTPNARSIHGKYNKAKSEIARLSQNYPIQGTSSDITKLATIYFFRQILEMGLFGVVKIVNLVHDEILVECPDELVDEMSQVLITSMVDAGDKFCTIVPLRADAVVGKHWVH